MLRKALLVAFAAVALMGCKAQVAAHPILIGDSISENAMKQVYENLSLVNADSPDNRYLYTPDVVGGIGVRTGPGLADPANYWSVHLRSVAQHVNPEVWVIELGTNDCRDGTADNWPAAIDSIMGNIPAGKPVVWLTLTIIRPDLRACADQVNAALAQAPDRWPDLTVFDDRTQMNEASYFQSDGIHYTDAGNLEYAKVVRAAIDSRVS